MTEISLGRLVKLNRLASVGKLINGLIHNLNGPLQNLGMDLEMMNISLARRGSLDKDLEENLGTRLTRMIQEFENIILQIRATSSRANDMDGDEQTSMDVNHFLQQELSFLRADLYFKHHVETNFEIDGTPPLIAQFPEDVPVCLGWLLQGLAEELQRGNIRKLSIGSSASPPFHQISLRTDDTALSPAFCSMLESDSPVSLKILEAEDEGVGLGLALYCLRESGARLTCVTEGSSSKITILLPVPGRNVD